MSKAKKILGLVLSVLMVLNLFSVAVSAVDAEVAENTTQAKTYTDFATAISEAEDGDEIVLTGRVKLDSLVEVKADITLDLAGNAVTTTARTILDVYSDLEILDSEGDGLIKADYNTIWVNEGAAVTLTSGKIYGTVLATGQNATFVMDGGTITAGAYSYCVSGNGSSGNGGTNIEINGGTIAGGEGAIYHPQAGNLAINGGTIKAETPVYIKSGDVEINGGSIMAVGAASEYSYYGNGFNVTGDAIVVDSCGYPGGKPSLKINGGKISSANAEAVAYYVYGKTEEAEAANELESIDFIKYDATKTLSLNPRPATEYYSLEAFANYLLDIKYGEASYANGTLTVTWDSENSYNSPSAIILKATANGDEITMTDLVNVAESTLAYGASNDATATMVLSDGRTINVVYGNFFIAENYDSGDQYTSLAAAIADAEDGETITLLRDTTITSYIPVTKDITIDLGGRTVSRASGAVFDIKADVEITGGYVSGVNTIFVEDDAALTVHDTQVDGTKALVVNAGTLTVGEEGAREKVTRINGMVIAQADGATVTLNESVITGLVGAIAEGATITNDAAQITGIFYLNDGARGVVNGGTIRNADGNAVEVVGGSAFTLNDGTISGDCGIYVAGQDSRVTVEGGRISAVEAAILGNGNAKNAGTVITLNGGNFSGSEIGLYQPQAGTTTINDGAQFKNDTAVWIKSGNVTINGGYFRGTANADWSHNGNGATATGDAVLVEACGYPGGNPVVDINDGTFVSDNRAAVAYYSTEGNALENENFIDGGKFTPKLAAIDLYSDAWVVENLRTENLANATLDNGVITLEPTNATAMLKVYPYINATVAKGGYPVVFSNLNGVVNNGGKYVYATANSTATMTLTDGRSYTLNFAMMDAADDVADYTAVNAAIAAANALVTDDIYDQDLVDAIEDAVDAVVANRPLREQAIVDSYAKTINDLLKQVVYTKDLIVTQSAYATKEGNTITIKANPTNALNTVIGIFPTLSNGDSITVSDLNNVTNYRNGRKFVTRVAGTATLTLEDGREYNLVFDPVVSASFEADLVTYKYVTSSSYDDSTNTLTLTSVSTFARIYMNAKTTTLSIASPVDGVTVVGSTIQADKRVTGNTAEFDLDASDGTTIHVVVNFQ